MIDLYSDGVLHLRLLGKNTTPSKKSEKECWLIIEAPVERAGELISIELGELKRAPYYLSAPGTQRQRLIEALYKQGPAYHVKLERQVYCQDNPRPPNSVAPVAALCSNLMRWPYFWIMRLDRGVYDLTPGYRRYYDHTHRSR